MATALASYSPVVFDALEGPKEQHLKQKSFTDFSDFNKLFHAHNMEQCAGIALLHRHYDVDEKEVVLETIDSQKSLSSPVSVASLPKEVVPHLWRFKDGKWFPTEFLHLDGRSEDDRAKMAEAKAFSDKVAADTTFLSQLGSLLEKLGVVDLFGLQTNHRRLFLGTSCDDTILEITDVPSRVSKITAVPQTQAQPQYFTDTFFGFACKDPETCGHVRRQTCGWTACAYGCCDDSCGD